MVEPDIRVRIHDETGKIELIMDEASYSSLFRHAKKEGITVEDLAKRIIEEGMKREMS